MRLEHARRDYYRRRAREEGYRSRAAYKLKQMDEKYRFVREGSTAVDLGSAPGGWLEVLAELVGPRGKVVGVDLVHVEPVGKNVVTLQHNMLAPDFPDVLSQAMGKGKASCLVADLSPKLSGIWDMDQFKQIDLCHKALDFLPRIVEKEGVVVMKVFQGEGFSDLMRRLRSSFDEVEILKPEASRKESSEVYLLARGFSGLVSPQPTEDLEGERQFEQPSDSVASDWP